MAKQFPETFGNSQLFHPLTRDDLPSETDLKNTISLRFPPCKNPSSDPSFPIYSCPEGTRPMQINAPYSTVTCGCVSMKPQNPSNLWIGTGEVPAWASKTYFTEFDCTGGVDKTSTTCEVYKLTKNIVIKAIENVQTDAQYQAVKKAADARNADVILNNEPSALSDAIQALYDETDPKVFLELLVMLNQFQEKSINLNVYYDLMKLVYQRLIDLKVDVTSPANQVKVPEKTFAEYKARVAKESFDQSLLTKKTLTQPLPPPPPPKTDTGGSGGTKPGSVPSDSTKTVTRDELTKQIAALEASQKTLKDQADGAKTAANAFPQQTEFDALRNAQNAAAAAFQKSADDIQKTIDEKKAALKKIDDDAAKKNGGGGGKEPQPEENEKSSIPWLWIGIGAGFLVLIIAIIAIVVAANKKKQYPSYEQPFGMPPLQQPMTYNQFGQPMAYGQRY